MDDPSIAGLACSNSMYGVYPTTVTEEVVAMERVLGSPAVGDGRRPCLGSRRVRSRDTTSENCIDGTCIDVQPDANVIAASEVH